VTTVPEAFLIVVGSMLAGLAIGLLYAYMIHRFGKADLKRALPSHCKYGHRACIHEWGHPCKECANLGRHETMR